jgi:alanyl-tRNA synthetase
MYYIEERDVDIELLAGAILTLTEQLEEQKKTLIELFNKVEGISKNSSNDEKANIKDVDLLCRNLEGVKIDRNELAEIIDLLKDQSNRTERTIPTLNNRVSILEAKAIQFGNDIGTLKANQAEMDYEMRKNRLL